jgi:hypothetical protein
VGKSVFCCALQVYGGAISMNVGPYVMSSIGSGNSSASCGETACSNCSFFVSGTSIMSSLALSRTSGDLFSQVHNVACHVFYLYA